MVDYRIEQRIRQIIRTRFPNPPAGGADACPHRIENIEVGLFLQRNQKSLAQKHAHLLAAHSLLRIQVKHLRNDEEIVIVLLGLRSLPGLEHILERKRMQMESFPEHAQ